MNISAKLHIALSARAQVILEEITGAISLNDISQKELGFLNGLVKEDIRFGSDAQNKWLDDIEAKVFKEDSDD